MAPVANNGPPRGFLLSTKPIVLWIHDPSAVYNHDAVVNPEMFPNFRDGQLLKILCPRITQQPQQNQNNNKSDQQDAKKQLDHNTPQQNQQQNLQQNQQNQQNQQLNQANQQQPLSEQSTLQPQLAQGSDKQEHHEQLEFVIVKGHAADKENLAKQQQLQVK